MGYPSSWALHSVETEFVRWEFYKREIQIGNGVVTNYDLPAPRFRMLSFVSRATLPDGQTAVLLVPGMSVGTKAKGADSSSASSSDTMIKTRKDLLIFVTPTLVYPDGTPIHSADGTPPAKSSSPPAAASGVSNTPILALDERLTLEKRPATGVHLTYGEPLTNAADSNRTPSPAIPQQMGQFATNRIQAQTLVQDARVLFSAGKLDEAEAKLRLAKRLDPENLAAEQYLELIAESRAAAATRNTDIAARIGLLQVEQAYDVPLRGQQNQSPNEYIRTNFVSNSKGRQNIRSKLDRIIIDKTSYDGLPLSEVLVGLSQKALARDPDKTGINFMFDHTTPSAGGGAIDPATGLPLPAAPESQDVSAVTIRIKPELHNLRLADVLDTIVKSAATPIRYSIDEYAVVFSLKGFEQEQLITRNFHIDPDTFVQDLANVQAMEFGAVSTTGSGGGGGGGSIGGRVTVTAATGGTPVGATNAGGGGLNFTTNVAPSAIVQAAVINFFQALGINLSATAVPPRSVFWNDRVGILMVHATAAELEIISQAFEAMNKTNSAPATQIKTNALLQPVATPKPAPAFHTNVIAAQNLVQEVRFLYEAGKWDEAEARLVQARKLDPENAFVRPYLELIAGRRSMEANRTNDVLMNYDQAKATFESLRTDFVSNSQGRQSIKAKLDSISIDTFKSDDLPLSEVLTRLSERVLVRDPDKKGVNFMFDHSQPARGTYAGLIDPATGLPLPALTAAVDISRVPIRLTQDLKNMPLAGVLDVIVTSTTVPIRYSIEEYGVVFSLQGSDQLFTRTFHVDTNTFAQALANLSTIKLDAASKGGDGGPITTHVIVTGATNRTTGSGGGTIATRGGMGGSSTEAPTAFFQAAVINFFNAAGINLSSAAVPPRSVFWNDRRGTLMVHATVADLDTVAKALEAMNAAPPDTNINGLPPTNSASATQIKTNALAPKQPQPGKPANVTTPETIRLQVKIAEIDEARSRTQGFDWIFKDSSVHLDINQMVELTRVAGPEPDGTNFSKTLISVHPVNSNPATKASDPTNNQSSITNTFGFEFWGVLDASKFKGMLTALERHEGVAVLNEPEIIAHSGRHLRIQNPATSANLIDWLTLQDGDGTHAPLADTLHFGPTLDLLTQIARDNKGVSIKINSTVIECFGDDHLGQFVVQAQVGAGIPLTSVLLMPHTRVRLGSAETTLADGATIVLAGRAAETKDFMNKKVPQLGDMPLLDGLFRSTSTMKTRKNLLVFITPTLIKSDAPPVSPKPAPASRKK